MFLESQMSLEGGDRLSISVLYVSLMKNFNSKGINYQNYIFIIYSYTNRLRWSRGSVLAFSTQV